MFNTKVLSIAASFILFAVVSLSAQVSQISLEQTKGEFTQQGLTLAPGQYQFEITNNGVGHDVGFVVAPKGMTEQKSHIKEAYVKAPVKDGSSEMTNVVSLTPGEYVYFCPLNPTEQYSLTVEADVEKIQLEQMPGKFTTESLMLKAGKYQFEIVNNGVDHEVGFVVAPKGMTEQKSHIKEAYVTAPVPTGKSSMTNVVTLTPGEYVYFCPLNPTEQHSLTVK